MKRNLVGFGAFALALAACAVVMCAVPVSAQEVSGDWKVLSIPNDYVTGSLGVAGTVKVGSDLPVTGRYSVVLNQGDPNTVDDDGMGLTYMGAVSPAGNYGFWKIKVGENVYLVGNTGAGYWSKPPVYYAHPPAGYGLGRSGGFVDGEWTVTDGTNPVVSLRIKMSLVRDQVRFELTLTNKSATTQSIGLLMAGDAEVSDNISVGYPYIPGKGYVRQAEGQPVRPQSMLFSGASVPATFDILDSVENPIVSARLTLKQQDAVAPDHLAIGEYAELCAASGGTPTWWLPKDFTPNYLMPVDDVAWVLCWNPRAIGRNGTRKIVTYYGCGAASSVWNYRSGSRMELDSAVLAVDGPRSLKYDTTDSANEAGLTPASFDVKAYLYNMATDPGPYELEDVTATLYLPPGLELDSQTVQTPQQAIGRVALDSESAPVTWTVRANGQHSGELQYFVTARAESGWQQVVSRKIVVPATKQSVLRSGYQLISVPYTFSSPTVDHAFGLPRPDFSALSYNPKTGSYSPVSEMQPGRSFWMLYTDVLRGQTFPFTVAADAAIVGSDYGKQVIDQKVDLLAGWNLIGNPFVYPIYWGQVLVYRTGIISDPVDLDTAVKYGWLSKTLYGWVPESSCYETFKDSDKLLMPWRGYWVRAKYPITMVFRPAMHPASDVTANQDGT